MEWLIRDRGIIWNIFAKSTTVLKVKGGPKQILRFLQFF